MIYMEENRQKMNDIIFAHRNKAYGAYAIRSAYGSTMLRALMIVSTTIGSLAFIAYRITRPLPDPAILPIGQEKIIECFYPPKDDPQEEKQSVEKKKLENKSGGQKSQANALVVSDSLLTQDSVASTIDLTAANTGSTASSETSTTAGNASITNTLQTDDGFKEIHDDISLDKMPEFEGGYDALRAYVMRRVKYPPEALTDGLEATVYVRFIVDEKGKVTNVQTLNSPTGGFVESAITAVKQVPDFKTPGYFKGKAVKCYYQLPIRFKLGR